MPHSKGSNRVSIWNNTIWLPNPLPAFVLCCFPSHTHTYTLIHIYPHTHMNIHTHTYMHILTHSHTFKHSHTHINTHTHMYIDTDSNTDTHTHTHTPYTIFLVPATTSTLAKFTVVLQNQGLARNICSCESSTMLPFSLWAFPHTQRSQRQGRMPPCPGSANIT